MTKTDFTNMIAAKMEISKKDAGVFVQTFLDTVTEELAKGEKIQFTGFGNFEVVERAAREGRNPSTGESLHIEASKSPKFKAGKALKDAVK